MAKLRLTQAARTDLKAIHAQREEMFGLAQADAYAAGLAKGLRIIADYPSVGRLRPDMKIDVRTLPYKAHVILYAFEDDEVVVFRVRHAREDWTNDTEEPPEDTP